ncbi:response regulator transcription factor [Daejeonella sp.]|uniref:response regulator transcription factor n=1 Tax=Daejeonella sp. TaxID=2805397 RepID=UPI0039836896
MKILIAEDDELMLRTLEFRLKKDGHVILIARDGQQAIALIDEHQPELVITDIMMPYSSGMEIVGYIRQKYQQKIKVIVLSGMGQENVILEAFQMGADDYITKPFSPNELSVRVNRFRPRQ